MFSGSRLAKHMGVEKKIEFVIVCQIVYYTLGNKQI